MLAGWQPTQKAIWKQSSFCKITSLNLWHYSSGQQANLSSACSHHTLQREVNNGNHVLEGSAQTTQRDTRVSGMETKSNSKRCETIDDIPERERKIRFLPRKSGHLKKGVKLTMLDREKWEKKLHSRCFIVPGALNYNRVLGALDKFDSAECTRLLIVPRALLCWNTADQGDWVLPGQKFFSIL